MNITSSKQQKTNFNTHFRIKQVFNFISLYLNDESYGITAVK